MTQKHQRKWYEAYRRGDRLREEGRLATVRELMDRARSLKGYVYSKPLPASDDQDVAVMRLGNWRDTFIHYKPMGLD